MYMCTWPVFNVTCTCTVMCVLQVVIFYFFIVSPFPSSSLPLPNSKASLTISMPASYIAFVTSFSCCIITLKTTCSITLTCVCTHIYIIHMWYIGWMHVLHHMFVCICTNYMYTCVHVPSNLYTCMIQLGSVQTFLSPKIKCLGKYLFSHAPKHTIGNCSSRYV